MSPIRPENADRYPADWYLISERIRYGRGLDALARPLGGFTAEAYLHADRVPLDEANLDRVGRKEAKRAQGRLRFSCSPWGCRGEDA